MKPNRCRFQYGMRTLLIFLLLASIGMAWFGVKMEGCKAATRRGRGDSGTRRAGYL